MTPERFAELRDHAGFGREAQVQNLFAEMLDEIERLWDRQDETRWRDPAAEQPAPWSLVLVAEQCAPEHKGSAREVTIGEQDPDGTWWDMQECRLFVTHWRPLPAPPEATA